MIKMWIGSLAVLVMGIGCVPTAQWKRENCHFEGAYATGMNEARAGKPMNAYQFVGVCPAEIESEILQGYREGYNVGLQARPLVEPQAAQPFRHDPHPAPFHAPPPTHESPRAGAGSSTDQMPCNNSLDCKPGFCRDRGDGVHLCMNKGQRGDFCTNGTECGFGLFCKEGPQGLKVCR